MIDRFTRPAMARVWSDQHKFETWLRVEVAVCEVWAEYGVVPADALPTIRAATVDAERVKALEEQTDHDVTAFLMAVAESTGPEASRWVHHGLTSSDVIDTALALQVGIATDLLLDDLDRLRAVLKRRALEHKDTLTIGRTHGVHAEPTTFGLKLALWYDEMGRNRRRLEAARAELAVGKISGAVGTHAHVPPAVEEGVCRRLDLAVAPISTQIVQRDRHALYLATLAVIAGSIEKIATEIRHLQRTEVREAEEPFGAQQTGSSAMPHKRNPHKTERLCGLARLMRGYTIPALETIALWHERDISNSSVERVTFPDATALLDYMLASLTRIIAGLVVYPERMRRNLDAANGVIYSQPVLLALIGAGLPRQEAYKLVQRLAMRAWEGEGHFRDLLAADPAVTRHLDAATLDALFDPTRQLVHVDAAFRRAGLLDEDAALAPGSLDAAPLGRA
ncbi:MAG: adenylosuccinate lyase [Chloroflexi bacterium]|nr:adenylosuccinate lyase [Chloroflexota bacterium]